VRVRQSAVFSQFERKTLEDFVPRHPSQELAVKVVRDYIESYNWEGNGLTFIGPCGIGKTFLASMVMNGLPYRFRTGCIRADRYLSLYRDKFELGALLKAGGDVVEDLEKTRRHLNGLERSNVLLLDDLGREYDSDTQWSSTQISNLIRWRYDNGAATLITSNMPFDFLIRRYSEAFVSFLREINTTVVMDGEDYRATGAVGD